MRVLYYTSSQLSPSSGHFRPQNCLLPNFQPDFFEYFCGFPPVFWGVFLFIPHLFVCYKNTLCTILSQVPLFFCNRLYILAFMQSIFQEELYFYPCVFITWTPCSLLCNKALKSARTGRKIPVRAAVMRFCVSLWQTVLVLAGFCGGGIAPPAAGGAPGFHSLGTRLRPVIRLSTASPAASAAGKTTAASRPFFRSPPARSATNPTDMGPMVPPRSPASARKANIAVPPAGQMREAMLMVPGHMMPTEKPHRAQPATPRAGAGVRDASR